MLDGQKCGMILTFNTTHFYFSHHPSFFSLPKIPLMLQSPHHTHHSQHTTPFTPPSYPHPLQLPPLNTQTIVLTALILGEPVFSGDLVEELSASDKLHDQVDHGLGIRDLMFNMRHITIFLTFFLLMTLTGSKFSSLYFSNKTMAGGTSSFVVKDFLSVTVSIYDYNFFSDEDVILCPPPPPTKQYKLGVENLR